MNIYIDVRSNIPELRNPNISVEDELEMAEALGYIHRATQEYLDSLKGKPKWKKLLSRFKRWMKKVVMRILKAK